MVKRSVQQVGRGIFPWDTGCRLALVMVLMWVLLCSGVEAGVPVISGHRVTDVATRSFTVLATVSEPSLVVLSLFGADCHTPVETSSVAFQHNSASGNYRFTLGNLDAATAYCYQITATSESTPDLTAVARSTVLTAALIVRTAPYGGGLIPVGNDIIKVPDIYSVPGEDRAAVLSSIELMNGVALSPLSRLLSASQSGDYVNLNNLFGAETATSYRVVGGERVKIMENHGSNGCVIERYRVLPAPSGGTAPRSLVRPAAMDIDGSGTVTILDILRIVGGKGSDNSGSCFNSDLDLNGDGRIDRADFSLMKSGFNVHP